MTKPNLFLSLLLTLLTLILSCGEDDSQKIVVLNPCIQTSANNIKLNERVIVKSCSDGNLASIETIAIHNPLLKQNFVLNYKTDSARIGFSEIGKYLISLRTFNLEAMTYSEWDRDTITVSE